MPNSKIDYIKHSDRQLIISILGAFLLATWCTMLLLPGTTFDKTFSSILLFPLRLAGIVPEGARLSWIWAQLDRAWWTGGFILQVITSVLTLILIWRCRILSVFTSGSRTARLLSGALLSVVILTFLDFFTSAAGLYPFGDQVRYLLLLSFVLAFTAKANTRWWQYLIGIILACVVLQSVYAIIAYYGGIDVFKSPGIGPRAAGTYHTPLLFYPIALIGISLLIPMALYEDQRPLRFAYWVSVLLIGVALLLTFTRAAMIGLAAGLIWLAWNNRQHKWLKVLTAFGLIVMVATMFARATTKEGSFGMDRSALGRVQIWRMSLNIIRDNWLWGVGHNGYQDLQASYVDKKAEGFNYTNIDPLNQALAMAANYGILGAGVFILFIYAVWAAYKNGKKEDYTSWEWSMKQGIVAAGIGLLTAGLVDTPLYCFGRYPGTFMWLVCMGFLLHLEVRNNPPSGEWRYAKAFRRVSLSLLMLAVIGIGYVITFGILDAHKASKTFDAKISEARSTPSYVSIKNIPRVMQECVIAEEDLFFYQHKGYSLVDMHRALRVNVRAGRVKQGGSTITQQLAKNIFFSHDRTLRRKVAEIIMAVKLEKKLSKKEILETYLNTIEYGLGSQGIDEATYTYFGKDASNLTDAECALLAGLIPSPPKEILTPERASSAIHLTLSRLKHTNPSRWISVQDELDHTGEDKWLKKHLGLRYIPRLEE